MPPKAPKLNPMAALLGAKTKQMGLHIIEDHHHYTFSKMSTYAFDAVEHIFDGLLDKMVIEKRRREII